MSQVPFFKTDTDEIVMTFCFQIMPKTLNPQWRNNLFSMKKEEGSLISLPGTKALGKRDDFIGRFVCNLVFSIHPKRVSFLTKSLV